MLVQKVLKKIDFFDLLEKNRARRMIFEKKNFAIYSFYKSNVSYSVIKGQRDVFESLGIGINQIIDDNISHGDFLNRILRDPKSPEYLVFFDIDCIPLKRQAIIKLLSQILDKKTIAGAAQTASHLLNGKNIYIGPFYFGISKTVYQSLGNPDMKECAYCDVGGMLTMIAKFQGEAKIKFWYPTHVQVPKWDLYMHGKFGLGTTYSNLVYHAFESRLGESDNSFVRKCREVITKRIK